MEMNVEEIRSRTEDSKEAIENVGTEVVIEVGMKSILEPREKIAQVSYERRLLRRS